MNMTIAEEQIKRLAQEAHGFAREAHSVASVLESKLEQFEQTHLPHIQAALASIADAKSVVDNSSGLVKALAEGLNAITAEVKAIRDDFTAFANKYIPMIEETFVKMHSAQIENANPVPVDETQTVTATEPPSQIVIDTTAETLSPASEAREGDTAITA